MARTFTTYVVLLFFLLGACPQDSIAAQRKRPVEPIPAPLLPVEVAWTVALESPPSAGGAMDDVRVYVPSKDALRALDRETGDIVWTFEISTAWPPLVSNGVVYIAANESIRALDAATGSEKWQSPIVRAPMAPMIVAGQLLLVLTVPDELLAIDITTGEREWRRELGGSSGAAGMVADSRAVYVSAAKGRLSSVALEDGTIRWLRTFPGSLSPPAVARDRVFVGSTENRFYALDPDDGTNEWERAAGGDVVGAVADGDLVVYAALDNIVRAVNRGNGNQRWKKEVTTRPVLPPRAFGGIVAVIGIQPVVSTYLAKTGAPVATYEAPTELQGPPLIDPVLTPFRVAVVAITRDGRAVGLRSVGMMFREMPITPLLALPGRAVTRESMPKPELPTSN